MFGDESHAQIGINVARDGFKQVLAQLFIWAILQLVVAPHFLFVVQDRVLFVVVCVELVVVKLTAFEGAHVLKGAWLGSLVFSTVEAGVELAHGVGLQFPKSNFFGPELIRVML